MAKKKAKKKPTIAHARKVLAMADRFKRIANAPLKHQSSSTAGNERQNKLTAARDAFKLRLKGTMELNKAKRAAKKKVKRRKKS